MNACDFNSSEYSNRYCLLSISDVQKINCARIENIRVLFTNYTKRNESSVCTKYL